MTFKAQTKTNLTATTIYNKAGFNVDGDAKHTYDFVSNEVCTTLHSGTNLHGLGTPIAVDGAELRFITPTFEIKKDKGSPRFNESDDWIDIPYYRLKNGEGTINNPDDVYNLTRDGVYVEVNSSSLNVDQDIAEYLVVELITGAGDKIELYVLETGANTGIFRSTRAVRMTEIKPERESGRCPNLLAKESEEYQESPHDDGYESYKQSILTPDDYSQFESACAIKGSPDGRIQVRVIAAEKKEVLSIAEAELGDTALIDPLGIVFDSVYNYPISGATVTIHNSDGSIALDPRIDEEYDPQVTGDDGRYQFPYLYPKGGGRSGLYYLNVVPPVTYTFPSSIPAITLTGNTGRTVNKHSYGQHGQDGVPNSGQFLLLPSSPDLVADIPIDPSIKGLFALEKSASKSTVGVGSFLTYSIKIQNFSDSRNVGGNFVHDTKLYNVWVHDRLPYGFRYVPGTAFFDDKKVENVKGAPAPNLSFKVSSDSNDNSLDNKPHTLTYTVRVTAGALDSDGINTAHATSVSINSAKVRSNTTKVKVKIAQDGVLDTRGIVFGKVYADADCDGIQNGGEWPIGGVKLYLEDGTWVITDGNGQYSLYGLSPGAHVIKLDPITLPQGLSLKPLDNRHMGDAGSRLVDITNGELHRADFATSCPKGDVEYVLEQIQARNGGTNDFMLMNAKKYDPKNKDKKAETNQPNSHVKARKRFGPTINRGHSYMVARYREKDKAAIALGKLPDSLEKEAFLYETGDFHTLRVGFSLNERDSDLNDLGEKLKDLNLDAVLVTTIYERLPAFVLERLESPLAVGMMAPAAEVIKKVTRKEGKKGTWLWPKGNTSLDGRFMVVVRAGMDPTLMVNGEAVKKAQIGEQIKNKREKTQVIAWYGIELTPGENKLEVVAKDPFGNQRVLARKVFKRPASAVKMTMTPVVRTLPADGGRTYLPVTIKLLDKKGYPARGTHFITISATKGRWVERDIQNKTQGHQVRVVNGERTIHLRSSEFIGDIKLSASDGELKANDMITQVIALRPIIAVGLVDIGVHHSRINHILGAPSTQQELSGAHGRAAFFMKGKVFEDSHLTLAYDSEKDVKGERFRDINPNVGYPMFGDAAQRGFEAQSRSKVYAKLERKKDSIMWGDYLSDEKTYYNTVDRVQRSLTGVNVVKETGNTHVQAYVSRPEDNHISEEIRGQGTALNYRIDKYPIIRNSELVEIITYSRDNPGLIVDVKKLSRFGGYTLDDETGDLSFSDSIPYQDTKQNPVFIRVAYDINSGGERYTVGGVRVNTQLSESINVGVSYSTDKHKTTGTTMKGASAQYKEGDLKITVSAAQMTHMDKTKGVGSALRLEVEKKWDKDASTRVTMGRANAHFTNSAGGISADSEELRLNHRQRVSKDVNLNLEAVHSKKLSTDAVQQTLGLTADVKVDEWTLKGGMRHIRQKNSGDGEKMNTIILGAKRSLDIMGRKASISTEYERDISDSQRQRLSLGGDIAVHDKIKLYGRAERISSLTGVGGLSKSTARDTIAFGVKSNILESTEIYSEYRLRGAIGARDMETASGIRGTYELEKGLSFSPRIEIVNTLEGTGKDSIATSIGIKDTRDINSKKTLRLEARHDDTRDYYGVEASYVGRLDEEWSILARDSARVDVLDSGDSKYNNTFTLGLSHRSRRDNKHNMLFLYKNKLEQGANVQGDCTNHILSTHQSYEWDDKTTLSGRLGGKYEKCAKGGTVSTSDAVVMDGRYLWDINDRWDVDVHGGVLTTNSFAEKRYSAGAGVSYLVRENLRLSAGYNVKGFVEKDLDEEGYNKEGVYFGMKYKFDENLFSDLFERRKENTKKKARSTAVESSEKEQALIDKAWKESAKQNKKVKTVTKKIKKKKIIKKKAIKKPVKKIPKTVKKTTDSLLLNEETLRKIIREELEKKK